MTERGTRTSARIVIALLLALAPIPLAPAAALSRTAEQASDRINQTGHDLALSVSLRDGGRQLGDVLIKVTADDTVLVSKVSLLEALSKELSAATSAKINALDAFAPIEHLQAAGLAITFDKQEVGLVIGMTADQRRTGDISLAGTPPQHSGSVASAANISGYVNLSSQADYLWDSDATALRFDAQVVARLSGFVLESEFSLQNSVDPLDCPNNALCLFTHEAGIERQGSRLIYDWPEDRRRLTLGDNHTPATSFQRSPDVLGVTIEESPQKLAPGSVVRSTGATSFTLERASTVEVLLNGALAQRLQLPAGHYNLHDLPLRTGSNEVTLLISDDAGAQRTLTFTSYSSYNLLGEGESEWALTAGVPSYFRDNGLVYETDQIFGSAFWRHGLESGLTVETQAQADNQAVMGGGGALMSTPWGLWGMQLAASSSTAGVGGAASLSWDMVRADAGDALRVAVDLRTSDFRTPGQITTPADGILYPTFQYRRSYQASYMTPLPDDWQATLSGHYDVAEPSVYESMPLAVRGNRYSADLTLSHALFDDATISAVAGYSNDIYNRPFGPSGAAAELADTRGEVWGGLRLFWRPAPTTLVSASTDSLSGRSLSSASYQSAPGLDSWTTSVSLADEHFAGTQNFNAQATYRGQRAEVTVAQSADTAAFAGNGTAFDVTRQRSSVRVASALVFADGHLAVSSPIRGDGGFAILYPHELLADKPITAGTPDYVRARSDDWGPAVITDLPAYASQFVPVDVADLPQGYSLGASGFDLEPPYRAGYALQVGSDYSVTVFGTLNGSDGKPLALASGVASNGQHQVAIVTNQGGKFAADGLASGQWTLEMNGDQGTERFVIDVPRGTQGLMKVGNLMPMGR